MGSDKQTLALTSTDIIGRSGERDERERKRRNRADGMEREGGGGNKREIREGRLTTEEGNPRIEGEKARNQGKWTKCRDK